MDISNIGNNILTWIQEKSAYLVSFLPTSPFRSVINQIHDIPYLSFINWFLPIDFCVGVLMAWTTAIAVYYMYMIVLRWVKAIE